jgi:AcrR family transcriptional regulator
MIVVNEKQGKPCGWTGQQSNQSRCLLPDTSAKLFNIMEPSVKPPLPDRRSQRTRRLISEAFLNLMREKHYAQITVQDIIDRADVGRSTFYAHYQDKEDLLGTEFAEVLHALQHNVNAENADTLPTVGLFEHIKEVQFIMKAFVLGDNADPLFRKVHLALTAAFERYLSARQPQPPIPNSIVANYLAGAYLSLVRWWLDNNLSYSPERMDEIFHDLAMPVIQSRQ